MNYLYYLAIFYSGTKHAPVYHLPPSLLTFTKTSSAVTHSTVLPLLLYPPNILFFGLIFLPHFLTPLSSLLTTHLHPSPAYLSEMTHYSTCLLQNANLTCTVSPSHLRLSRLPFIPLFLTHTPLDFLFPLSVRPPSRTCTPFIFPSITSLIRLLFLPYHPPLALLVLPSIFWL